MQRFDRSLVLVLCAASVPATVLAKPVAKPPAKIAIERAAPPYDLLSPPSDATKTPSGLVYVKEFVIAEGPTPNANSTVVVRYKGWRTNGDTFFNSKDQSVTLPLRRLAPGLAEALLRMKKGEKATFWIPAGIGFVASAPAASRENQVYEIEPPVPADVAHPPATAKKSKSGIASVELLAAIDSKSDAVREWDSATFFYTAWDDAGQVIESNEGKLAPAAAVPMKQVPGLNEAFTGMRVGERKRFWIPSTLLRTASKGNACYEIEILEIQKLPEPPHVPTDVAAPPAGAQQTAAGVFYNVLTTGRGIAHPTAADTVKVNYTGWTTDGKMFDTSVGRGQPAEFPLPAVIAGWTDGVQTMVVGEKARFWIPQELAYKGAPGRPAGMLVFDIELLEIKPQRAQIPQPDPAMQ